MSDEYVKGSNIRYDSAGLIALYSFSGSTGKSTIRVANFIRFKRVPVSIYI